MSKPGRFAIEGGAAEYFDKAQRKKAPACECFKWYRKKRQNGTVSGVVKEPNGQGGQKGIKYTDNKQNVWRPVAIMKCAAYK